ncbi:putative replication origin-binding protein [Brazilian marseillevirus]|uniref:replication n=1 Tax=Brazilian marseillevirus TaxID=1813599 RepID=UPI000784B5A8|nr:replication [Brazilian marseillevirus]AMQ10725.1 putative replication origin-binding protein [Brazilian marseillevirus]
MSMSLAVHVAQTTIPTTFSSYSRFYPKTCGEDKLSCPLCSFQGKNKGDLKAHYSNSFHLARFSEAVKASALLSLEWERKDGESKRNWRIRTSLLQVIGIPPPYLRVTLFRGYPTFSHALKREDSDSFYERSSRGENLLKPIDFAIKYGKELGREMFCVYEKSATSRVFLSFPTFEDYWKVLSSTKDGEKSFHELFVSGRPTREIFDLETEAYEEGHFDPKEILRVFSKARREFEPGKDISFRCLESSGKTEKGYKFSLHIISTRMHRDLVSMKDMFDKFTTFLVSRKEYFHIVALLDRGIYTRNRSIRGAWSVKIGSTRRLLPLSSEPPLEPKEYFASVWSDEYEPEPVEYKEEEEKEEKPQWEDVHSEEYEDYLVDYCENQLEQAFEVLKDTGHFWKLQRRKNISNFCPICEREHGGDNMFAVENELGLLLGCYRGEKDSRTKLLVRNKERVKSHFLRIRKVVTDIPEILADEVCCSKEVEDFVQREGTATVVVSSMGTGKTKALIRYLEKHPEASVLFVTYRRSLAKELWTKLDNFSHYESISGDIHSDKLVVQIDSLHRVKRTAYDIIVCDEVTYMFNRLVRYVTNTELCWKTLKYYLKESKESFFLDKNMNSSVTDVLQRLGIPTYVIKNEFKAHTSRTCFVSRDFLEFKTSLLDDLISGLKICLASSSKKKLEIICKEAETLGHSVLWYTGDGKSEDVWLDKWKDYDLIAYSPTISAGVSYEEKHFDKVYGYFSAWSCCAEECEQMLFRVRNIEKNEMTVCFDGRSIKAPITRRDVQTHIKRMDNCSKTLPCIKWDRKTPGCPLDMNHIFTRLYVDSVVRENVSKRALSSTLLWLLKEQGVCIKRSTEEMTEKEREEALEQLAETKNILRKEEVEGFCGAPKIEDKAQFEYLCNLKDRTKEENFSIKKYLMASRLEVEQDDIKPEFFVAYKDQVKQYSNLKVAFSGSEEERKTRLSEMADELNFEKQKMGVVSRLECGHVLERIVYAKRLLKLLGFEDISSRKRIKKEEMGQRLKHMRERVSKSRYFQELFTSLPKEENQDMKWANVVLERVFGCSVLRTSKNKYFSWYLCFSSPWICNGKELETKNKVSETTRIPTF